MKKILLLILATVVLFSCKDEDFPVPTALYVENTSPVLSSKGETLTLPIETTAPSLEMILSSEVDWCTVKQENSSLVITADNNPSLAARTFDIQLKAPDRDIKIRVTQEGQPTMLLTVASGTASSEQQNYEIAKSFDGKDNNDHYHSKWGIDASPYTLVYNLKDAPSLTMISYYPRKDGGLNGVFGEVEIHISTKANPDFVKVMDHDFGGLKVTASELAPTHLILPEVYQEPTAVRFVVKTGRGGFASCSEMEFYGIK